LELLGGVGDMLEVDHEYLHQMSQKISYRTSRIKNPVQQAMSHSKMEAKLNNKESIEKQRSHNCIQREPSRKLEQACLNERLKPKLKGIAAALIH
jgi:hypothetical protein